MRLANLLLLTSTGAVAGAWLWSRRREAPLLARTERRLAVPSTGARSTRDGKS